jgi:hypothetical protein
MGIAASIFAIFIGFVPPDQIEVGSKLFYVSFLVIGLLIMCGIPLFFYALRKPHWIRHDTTQGIQRKKTKK